MMPSSDDLPSHSSLMEGLSRSVEVEISLAANTGNVMGDVAMTPIDGALAAIRMDPAENPARTIQRAAGSILGLIGMPLEVGNAGVAAVTSQIPSTPIPAAVSGSLYMAPPHTHLHPPSLVPPAPPIPLPSFGPMLIGVSPKVLIGGMPAARAGDLGFAPTCGGFSPAFEAFTGSSKVFIAGTRAARTLDMGRACIPGVGGPIRGFAAAMMAAGQAVAMAGVAADAIDSSNAEDTHLASAHGQAAALGAAQQAADLAAMSVASMLGTDPTPMPFPGMMMAPVTTNVLIGGFPMPNLPDPAMWLFKKAKASRMRRRARRKNQTPEQEATPARRPCGGKG